MPLLEKFDANYFDLLTKGKPSLPATASGGVQFVSMESARGTQRSSLADLNKGSPIATSYQPIPGDDIAFPVVVCVGINYWQDRNSASLTSGVKPIKRFLDPTIIDFDSQMRSAFNCEFAAYQRNPVAWVTPLAGRDAHASHVPELPDYILIATNFSPFITTDKWGEMPAPDQSAILAAWPKTDHLDSLFRLIGHRVDLWIGHGKSHCWPKFDVWRKAMGIQNWMTTFNLSALGTLNVNNARKNRHPLYKDNG